MIDTLWVILVVTALIGIWALVVLVGHLCMTCRELLEFLKHKELLDHHATASIFEREMRSAMRPPFRKEDPS
jgi:hypothetical protein